MDQDLIKLVNRLQDTFHNLGMLSSSDDCSPELNICVKGGELDMPQLVVVCLFANAFMSEL